MMSQFSRARRRKKLERAATKTKFVLLVRCRHVLGVLRYSAGKTTKKRNRVSPTRIRPALK